MAHEDLKKLAEVKTFNAYYFSLNGTGCEPVDAVLAAIARAGKDSHHTSYWDETYGNGVSHVQKIQEAANQAASAIAALQQEVETLRDQLAQAREDALEEAAKRLDELAADWSIPTPYALTRKDSYEMAACHVRALKHTGEDGETKP